MSGLNLAALPPPAMLLDTTLRDGEQSPGVALKPDEKAEYVRLAEEAGVRYIEVGFPQNDLDFDSCLAAAKAARSSRIVVMSLATPEGVRRACDVGAHEVLFVVPSSSSHLRSVYGRSFEALADGLCECLDLAAANGLAANVGLEDAGQCDMSLIQRVLDRLSTMADKVDCVTVPDTRGELLPGEVERLLASVRSRLPGPSCRLAFHGHNDLGLATANSLAALQMDPSVDCVHVTTCGFGERAGNTSLEQMAVLLEMKLRRGAGIVLKKLPQLAAYVQEAFLTPLHAHAPVVGWKVFLHESGLHQKGMLNDSSAYQYLDPELFGLQSGLVLGKHSGKHLRRHLARLAHCDEEEVWKLELDSVLADKSEALEAVGEAARQLRRASLIGLTEAQAVSRLKSKSGPRAPHNSAKEGGSHGQ